MHRSSSIYWLYVLWINIITPECPLLSQSRSIQCSISCLSFPTTPSTQEHASGVVIWFLGFDLKNHLRHDINIQVPLKQIVSFPSRVETNVLFMAQLKMLTNSNLWGWVFFIKCRLCLRNSHNHLESKV